MTKSGGVVLTVLVLGVCLRATGETYKYTYQASCQSLWPAVVATLSDEGHYAKVKREDAKMKAAYQPKHDVHVDVTGVLLQRMNHVTLVPKGTGCEMQVGSNYSGWGHDDQGDFKKRVDEALAKPKDSQSAQPATPAPQPQ